MGNRDWPLVSRLPELDQDQESELHLIPSSVAEQFRLRDEDRNWVVCSDYEFARRFKPYLGSSWSVRGQRCVVDFTKKTVTFAARSTSACVSLRPSSALCSELVQKAFCSSQRREV